MGRASTAWGGILAPIMFVSAWIVSGTVQEDYSPVHDQISRLAAVDAPVRVLMTLGLVALGAGLVLFAAALRASIEGPAWVGAMVTGLASLGVAATPLGRTDRIDDLHATFAIVGYVSLVAIPLLAAGRLKRRGLARLSLLVGILAGMCLVGSVLGLSGSGALQRAGLTLVHAWVVGVAASQVRERSSIALG